jgi:hypothetical protein
VFSGAVCADGWGERSGSGRCWTSRRRLGSRETQVQPRAGCVPSRDPDTGSVWPGSAPDSTLVGNQENHAHQLCFR